MKRNEISNILVPLDFSEASFNALETAIVIAKQKSAKITLVNVVDTSFMFGFKGVYYISERTIDSLIEVSADMLNPLVKKLKEEHKLECDSEIKVGLVSQSIIKSANTINADLIVMGTHGLSGFRKFFMGSTAQKVVRFSSHPVLTIPSNRRWLDFKKILFPIRPVHGAIEKYDFLMKVIAQEEASIDILILAFTYDETEKRLLHNSVKEFKRKAMKDRVEISGALKVGTKMSQAVLKMSKSIEADMIVITRTIDSRFKQFFIDPFEQQIVNHATMPVLSVRAKVTSPDLQVVIQQIHESFPNPIPSFS